MPNNSAVAGCIPTGDGSAHAGRRPEDRRQELLAAPLLRPDRPEIRYETPGRLAAAEVGASDRFAVSG